MDLQLSKSPMQNVDLIMKEQQQRQGEELAAHLSYWRQQLEDAPVALDLPTDHPRSPTQSGRRAQYSFVLPLSLSTELKQLSQQKEIDLCMILLAAFQALLYRYTGQDDLLIGIPGMKHAPIGTGFPRSYESNGSEDAGRSSMHDAPSSILILRARMSGNPSFQEVMERAREVVLEAYAHQDVPFEQIVELVQPEPTPGRHPLCQVLFDMETGGRDFSLSGRDRARNDGMPKVDLFLAVQDTMQELSVLVEYTSDLFEEATITRMLGHWQMVLQGIVADPEQRLSELPILTSAERHQLLVEWNDTQADYPREQCIHQLFEEQVRRTPDAVALVSEDVQLTYQQLNQRANQLAHDLQRLGVGPEVPVGLCVERSPEMIVGLLAILKAGGAYVPLDPTYPKERLTFILEDIHAPLLLTQEHLREGLVQQSMRVVCLDRDGRDRLITSEESGDRLIASEENPQSSVTAENAAYILYTSGTTGTPKGVVIQHKSLVNYSEFARVTYALKPSDRVLQFATINFDASAEEIYPCLTSGAALVLRTNAMIDSVSQFLQKCQEWALTVLDLPTAYWHELTRKIAAESLMLPPSVRVVIIGGERALPELVALWRCHVDQRVQLMNTYGPTEATIVATMHSVSEFPQSKTSATDAINRSLQEVPIGRPIANVQVYLFDQYLKLVPIGVPGELHIGGVGLAREYFNRPELTAEKFIPHPFCTEPGARLYKTGDLVRYLPNGDIEFLGRIDHQVKIRGYRIELGEIEAALKQHRAVQEAVVIAREDTPSEKRLVAYVVPYQGQMLTSGELRSSIRQHLPNYMMPSAFVLMESLPLSSNGKLDLRVLPAPDLSRRELDETFEPPTLPVHQQLVHIWEDLLDIRPIGIRDNFFELGGHSLLAVRLVDQIEQFWGKRISATALLAGPTIEQLANVLVQTESTNSDAASANARGEGSKHSGFSVRRLLGSLVKTTGRK